MPETATNKRCAVEKRERARVWQTLIFKRNKNHSYKYIINKQIKHFCDTFVITIYTRFSYGGIKKIVKELFDSPSVSQSSKDVIIVAAGIDRSLIFDQSVECQASIEVGVQVRGSVRNVGTQVAPKSIEIGSYSMYIIL